MKKKFVLLLLLFLSFFVFACKSEVTPEFSDEYEYDETYHWHPSKNTDDISGKAEHIFYDNVCVTCGYEYKEPGAELQEKYNAISIKDAIKKATEAGEAGTQDAFCVYGTIERVSNATYGEMYLTDGEASLYVYGTYASDGTSPFSSLDPTPKKGDEIVVYGVLKTYNGSPEMGKSVIKEYISKEIVIDLTKYEEMSIKDARSEDSGALVKLSGVVAFVTYANGMAPNGFYLVDNTGSIYVYGLDSAGQVKKGNTVTIIGEKIYYLPEGDTSASKFNYKGANQIQEATVLTNDKGNSEFNKTWIKESSVKDILDTDFGEDITSSIFKVTTLIKKVPGSGFVNYYMNDLDEKTSSYVYTLCNGNDFAWLDEFDGKVCEVYLSPLNVKVSSTYGLYRFIPLEVSVKDNYKLSDDEACAFALKYYAKDQFMAEYNSDPALELLTDYQSELLSIEGLKISYQSSNEAVIKFETKDNKTYMHALSDGDATITITAALNGKTKTEEFSIKVKIVSDVSALTVKEAIEKEDGEIVEVQGVVAASVANQTAFYLIDETGIIAVKMDSDVLNTLSLGDEVVVKGTRTHYVASGNQTVQSVILDATLVVNYFGGKDYSTASFVTDKTFTEISMLEVLDYTTIGYTVNCKLVRVSCKYYSNIYLVNEECNRYLMLYCSSANQYNWAKDFYVVSEDTSKYTVTDDMIFEAAKNAEVYKMDIALCNWNVKSYNRAGIIAIYNEDGSKVLNTLNFQN